MKRKTALCSETPLTLFRSGGYQIDTCLPFSLYLRHGFRSESEQPDRNRVKQKIKEKYENILPEDRRCTLMKKSKFLYPKEL